MDKDLSVHVNKAINIPIHEQIYMQLKNMILIGDLDEGMRLPSVRQMSDMINVNRHTIAKAYFRLESEQLVETFASSGTFVKKLQAGTKVKETEELTALINTLFIKGKELGFDKYDVLSLAYSSLLKVDGNKHRGLFIECNASALASYVQDIRKETNLDIDGRLLDELRARDDLSQYDVILTTMGHYAEVKSTLRLDNIYAINFGPYLSVVKEIRQCEPKTRFGIICISDHGSNGLRDVLIDLGISKKQMTAGSLEEPGRIKEIIDTSDVLIVSKYALNEDPDRFNNVDRKIIEYKNVLQKSSIRMLEEIISMQDKMPRRRDHLKVSEKQTESAG